MGEVVTDEEGGPGAVLGGYRGRMLLSLSAAWAILQTGRFALAPLLPAITADLAISAATAGIAISALQAAYAATQYPSGRYSDRAGRATLVVPGLVALVCGFALVGVATSFAAFLAGAVVIGFGKGLFASPSRALLYELFDRRRGRALGIYTAGTDVGGLIAAGFATAVLAAATWRALFWPVALALAALGALYIVLNREPYTLSRPPLRTGETVKRLAGTAERRLVLGAYTLFFVFVSGFITFLPTFLGATKGYPETVASAIFASVFVVGLVTKPVTGSLSDRFDRTLVGATGLAVAGGALLCLVAAPSLPVVLASLVVLAVGYKTQFPLADALVMETAPAANVGGDLGAAKALFLGAGSLGPALVGVVATRVGYGGAYVLLAGALFASGALLAWRYLRARSGG